MITQLQKRSGVAGYEPARHHICILRFIQRRLRAQFFSCRVNLFLTGSISLLFGLDAMSDLSPMRTKLDVRQR